LNDNRDDMNEPSSAFEAARRDGKRLMRLARTGALATLDDGKPLTTLVGVASDWDGSPLFLMSDLARHTKLLALDARVSLLLTSEGGRGDPLNQPRVTLNGVVRRREGRDGACVTCSATRKPSSMSISPTFRCGGSTSSPSISTAASAAPTC